MRTPGALAIAVLAIGGTLTGCAGGGGGGGGAPPEPAGKPPATPSASLSMGNHPIFNRPCAPRGSPVAAGPAQGPEPHPGVGHPQSAHVASTAAPQANT